MSAAFDFAIHAHRVFDGERFHANAHVLIKGDNIVDITNTMPNGKVIQLEKNAILAPGFIDAQVNGGGGVIFNDAPDAASIAAIAAAHRRFGTTSLLPTLISDTRTKIETAIAAVREAMKAQPSVLGIHVEGPFLNADRKGVHPASHIIEARNDDAALLSALGAGGVTLVTLAPEKAPPGLISDLTQRGVIVSAGHTQGTAEQIESGIEQGVRGFTHLYNAMSQLNVREPGAVGVALGNEDTYASIIADGWHVATPAIKTALRAKTPQKLFLVSDAMASLGSDTDSFKLFGETIHVENGRLATAQGTLAGAHLDMASAVRFMVQNVGASLEDALTMATATPAAFLKIEHRLGRIAPGLRADLVMLDENFYALDSWVAGKTPVAVTPAKEMR